MTSFCCSGGITSSQTASELACWLKCDWPGVSAIRPSFSFQHSLRIVPVARSARVAYIWARAVSPKWRSSSDARSEEHTSELQSQFHLVCRLLLEKKKKHEHQH